MQDLLRCRLPHSIRNRKRSGSRFPQNGKTKISQVERRETFHQTVGSLMLVPCGQRTDCNEKKSR
jgi:hypothetical protein